MPSILTGVTPVVIFHGIGQYLVPMVWFDFNLNGVQIMYYPLLVVVVFFSSQIAPFICCYCVMCCAQVTQFDVIQAVI